MAKVGLKDTLALLAKGYSKKEIDALAAIDDEAEKEAEAPDPETEDKKAPDDAAAKESNQEPDYKKLYEELLEKNQKTEAIVTKLQQDNVHKDSTPLSDEDKKKQDESLHELFRSFM